MRHRGENLYRDLNGRGLSAALRLELEALGSAVEPSWDPPLALWASARRAERSVVVCAALETRKFGVDLWSEGIQYFSGWSTELSGIAVVAPSWLDDDAASAAATAARFPHLELHEFACDYERGDAIERRWRSLLEDEAEPLFPLVEAAAAEPRLRRLFPFTSLGRLKFSRWVGYPFSGDLPGATPRFTRADAVWLRFQTMEATGGESLVEAAVGAAIRANTYRVYDPAGMEVGEGEAARAVELLVGALPEPLEVVYRRPADLAY
jgi:hypothetical protein